MALASCRPSGAQNFEVAPRFVANFSTADVYHFGHRHDRSKQEKCSI
jgi:hypothetical protein